jgi:hypothetical protein
MNGIPGSKSATKIFDAPLFNGISLSFFNRGVYYFHCIPHRVSLL